MNGIALPPMRRWGEWSATPALRKPSQMTVISVMGVTVARKRLIQAILSMTIIMTTV
jgi:hypothetical protein